MQPTSRLRRLYVDAAGGSDTAVGLPSSPLATLPAAVAKLPLGGTIAIRASDSDPVVDSIDLSPVRDLALVAWGDDMWHHVGTPTAGYALRSRGFGLVTLVGYHGVGDGLAGVRVGLAGEPAGTGRMVAVDSYAEGQSGWSTSGQFRSLTCIRCTGLGTTNDGYNLHGTAGVATLLDCVGSDCGDEGASPHDDVILNIVGGEYRRNVQAGMAAVGNAVCNISGWPRFVGNGTGGVSQFGGVYFDGATSGAVDGAIMEDNVGSGVFLATSEVVDLAAYRSRRNGAADQL